jgi:hypothetical protein
MSKVGNLIYTDYLNIVNAGNYNIQFFCNDSANNLVSSSVYNFVYVASSVSTSQGGESITYYAASTTTTLDSLEITFDKSNFFDNPITITVKPMNVNKSIVTVDKLNITLLTSLPFTESNLLIDENNIYSKNFIIEDNEISQFDVLIISKQNDKIISETRTIYLTKMNTIDSAGALITGFTISSLSFFSDNWLIIILFIGGICIIALILSVITFVKTNGR